MRGVNQANVIMASAALAAAAAGQGPKVAPKELEPGDVPALSVGQEDGSVLMVHDRPVDYVKMAPEAAIELAVQLVQNARAAGYPRMVVLAHVDPATVEAAGEYATRSFADVVQAATVVGDAVVKELRDDDAKS